MFLRAWPHAAAGHAADDRLHLVDVHHGVLRPCPPTWWNTLLHAARHRVPGAACMAGLRHAGGGALFGPCWPTGCSAPQAPAVCRAGWHRWPWCTSQLHAAFVGAALPQSAVALIGGAVALMSVGSGAGAALMMEAPARATIAPPGMSVDGYSLGVTVFGGFAPLIVTWLIAATGSSMAPAWYLLASACISLSALALFPSHPGRD
ncbi:hypothetical protein ACU4GD_08405 [Cupriavidus basilensis]